MVGAGLLSALVHDSIDAYIILGIVIVSGLLGFWQEHDAANSVEKLLAVVELKTKGHAAVPVGFVAVPLWFVAAMAAIVLADVASAKLAKRWSRYVRRRDVQREHRDYPASRGNRGCRW